MFKVSVDELIDQTLRADNTPITEDSYSIYQVAKFLDLEFHATIVPMTVALMEEYLVTNSHFSIDANVNRITIPGNAAGFRVRDIYLFPQNTNNGGIKAIRLNPDQLPYIVPGSNSSAGGYWGAGPSYYIENNEIIFYPRLSQPYIARVRYLKSPNHLYPYASCTTQVLVKTPPNLFVLSSIPTGLNEDQTEGLWTNNTGVNKTTFDVITPDHPFNFRRGDSDLPLINQDILSIDTASNTISVSDEVYANTSIGDFLATTGTFGYVQFLPPEANNLLIHRASMRILKAQGDLQNLGVTAQLYNAAANDYSRLLTPKVENSNDKVSNFSSPIGRGNYGGFGGGRGR